MATGNFVAYYRVSTERQGRSGLGLEAQRHAVQQWLNGGNWSLIGEYTEVESGARSDRKQLLAAIAQCRVHRAKLVIAKLDRLARNVAFVSNLMESGVDFVAVDFPEANRLTVHILAAVAEHERGMISERITAALQAAKARGTKLGGWRGGPLPTEEICKLAATARTEKARQWAQYLAATVAAIQAEGIVSANGIAKALNERNIPTPRNGKWHPSSVIGLLKALGQGG